MGQKVIHVLNGPNLDLLGQREPAIYGHQTLADVEALCRAELDGRDVGLIFRQTNAEHEMVGWLHEARIGAYGVILNPAAFEQLLRDQSGATKTPANVCKFLGCF